jgi:tRNA(Ile)-lysidine synthase
MNLLKSLRHFCYAQGIKKRYWIALSGGLDSQVLLLLAHQLRTLDPISLRAIHINHGLSPHAKTWEESCALLCRQYEIDFTAHRLSLDLQSGVSIEAAAREARYQALAGYLSEDDVLLSAHHQDDQAETIFLQLLRGAGLKGLSAMPSLKTLGNGLHGRPLLHVSRQTLETYAREHRLNWIDDEMNREEKLTRNFLRHQVFPMLKTRWQTVANTMARSARHCADAQDLLDEFAGQMLETVKGSKEHTLSVSKLLQLSPKQQQLMLRAWIYQAGYRLPETKKMQNILQTVLGAAWDRRPCVVWDEVELRRHRDDLYLLAALPAHDRQVSFSWQLSQTLALPGVGELQARLEKKGALCEDLKTLEVRFRQGGEVVSFGTRGHRTLKHLFQEWQVLPWERERIPLLFFEGELIAVPDYFLDERFKAKEKELGWKLYFSR